MSESDVRYDVLVESALRGVVRQILENVGEDGLAGEQHFYVTFRTGDAEVEVPEYLRKRYPAEMTIVLQYQFYGLEVTDSQFAVTLTFNNVPERLVIPFEAITVFADPSVNFALQFQGLDQDDEDDADGDALPTGPVAVDDMGEPVEIDPDAPAAEGEGDEDDEEKTGEVVSLDQFRKNR
ncbi:MAG: hypothetical protein KI792_03365 [Alphaproteobacteria bacterium]|nr:hypothetical protein [Alphaproteobacteria bacterium SS10]